MGILGVMCFPFVDSDREIPFHPTYSFYVLMVYQPSLLNGKWRVKFRVSPSVPVPLIVNHFLFVDDSLLFCRANGAECIQIYEILNSYECVLGEKVNLIKSEMCFSQNIKRPMQSKLAYMLGVQKVDQHVMYLGMPTFVGRNKSQCFVHIKERLWKRLQSWKEKVLSAAGK